MLEEKESNVLAEIRKIMDAMRHDFRWSERFMAASHARKMPGMTNVRASDESTLQAYRWSLVQRHQGTQLGFHLAANQLMGDLRDIFNNFLEKEVDSICRRTDLVCQFEAVKRAVLISTGYGECMELANYLYIELLRKDIPAQRMALIDKDKIVPSGTEKHPLRESLHLYVRVPLPNGVIQVIDPFFDIICPEREYLTHPTIQKYIKSHFPIDRAVEREFQYYPPEMLSKAKIAQIDKITALLITTSKKELERVKEKYAPYLEFLPVKEIPIESTISKTSPCFTFFNRRTCMITAGAIAGALSGGFALLLAGAATGFVSEVAIEAISESKREMAHKP